MIERFGGVDDAPLQPATNALGEWYVRRVSLPGRTSVVLFVSEPSRLAVLVPGRGSKTTVQQFRERTAQLLRRIDCPDDWVEAEVAEMEQSQLAPIDSHSVLSTMKELAQHLTLEAEKKDGLNAFALDDQELMMSRRLHGPFASRPPRDVARTLCKKRWKERG